MPMRGLGAELQRAERLIRLGVRVSVVCEALQAQGPRRALIERLYAGLRGSQRPRGPLPADVGEVIAHPAARLHASLFIADWATLRAAGAAPAEALAGAWARGEAIDACAAAIERRLCVDHAWVLGQAYDRGELVQIDCATCGCRHVELRGRAAAEASRCPHCAPARRAGLVPRTRGIEDRAAAERAAAERRARAALATAAAHPLSELAQRHVWAEALFHAGARPPTVTQLTGLRLNKSLRQLYIDVVGHPPHQGALPQLGLHVVATYSAKLQASVITVLADRLQRAGCTPAEMVLATWTQYRRTFGAAARFDLDALALVVRARNHPDFAIVRCGGCQSSYLELRFDRPGARCPVCRMLHRAQRAASVAAPDAARADRLAAVAQPARRAQRTGLVQPAGAPAGASG
jgi:hypothetical protein